MEKQCLGCKEDFEATTKKQVRCKSCKTEYDRLWYEANKERIKTKKQVSNTKSYDKRRMVAYEHFLNHPCVDCGESDPIVLEFDHRDDSEKSFTISNAISSFGCTLAQLKKEIEKCDVRCANCHRRRTAKQFNWFSRLNIILCPVV